MDYVEGFEKDFKKVGIAGVCVILALIAMINSCSIVQQRERGVKYVLGKVVGDVIQPGLTFHAPFMSKIKKYSIAPKTYDAAFSVDNGGAITRDMQTVGTSVTVKYAYDENRIMDIASRYGDSVVESAMKSNSPIRQLRYRMGARVQNRTNSTILNIAFQGNLFRNGSFRTGLIASPALKRLSVNIRFMSWSKNSRKLPVKSQNQSLSGCTIIRSR